MDSYGEGFDWQNHEVHTDDGYILNVFRLVPTQGGGPIGEPVFI